MGGEYHAEARGSGASGDRRSEPVVETIRRATLAQHARIPHDDLDVRVAIAVVEIQQLGALEERFAVAQRNLDAIPPCRHANREPARRARLHDGSLTRRDVDYRQRSAGDRRYAFSAAHGPGDLRLRGVRTWCRVGRPIRPARAAGREHHRAESHQQPQGRQPAGTIMASRCTREAHDRVCSNPGATQMIASTSLGVGVLSKITVPFSRASVIAT